MTVRRIHPGPRMSEIAIFNGVVYLAGQIPRETRGQAMQAQASEVLGMIDRLLADAGSDKSRLLSCQIFLRDLGQFAAMNEVWDAWVVPGQAPCRATVQAGLASAGCDIEIIVTAAA